jgi:hypothetical protein
VHVFDGCLQQGRGEAGRRQQREAVDLAAELSSRRTNEEEVHWGDDIVQTVTCVVKGASADFLLGGLQSWASIRPATPSCTMLRELCMPLVRAMSALSLLFDYVNPFV